MYELLILGSLARYSPMHGYMIAKVVGNIMGPFKHVQWGALYPVLNRLEADGLIRAEERGEDEASSRKAFSITDAGHQRLREHLLDTERHLGEYSTVFCFKVSLFFFLTPEERLHLCRHYAVFAQQNLDHFTRKTADVEANALGILSREHIDNITPVMRHRIAYWQAERAWAEELIQTVNAGAVPAQ